MGGYGSDISDMDRCMKIAYHIRNPCGKTEEEQTFSREIWLGVGRTNLKTMTDENARKTLGDIIEIYEI